MLNQLPNPIEKIAVRADVRDAMRYMAENPGVVGVRLEGGIVVGRPHIYIDPPAEEKDSVPVTPPTEPTPPQQ